MLSREESYEEERSEPDPLLIPELSEDAERSVVLSLEGPVLRRCTIRSSEWQESVESSRLRQRDRSARANLGSVASASLSDSVLMPSPLPPELPVLLPDKGNASSKGSELSLRKRLLCML